MNVEQIRQYHLASQLLLGWGRGPKVVAGECRYSPVTGVYYRLDFQLGRLKWAATYEELSDAEWQPIT